MGVDFYTCHSCNDTFCDAGPYISCDGCGRHWCDKECAHEDGFIINTEEDEAYSTCKFCRMEAAEDYELLNYLLTKYGINRGDLEKEYLAVQIAAQNALAEPDVVIEAPAEPEIHTLCGVCKNDFIVHKNTTKCNCGRMWCSPGCLSQAHYVEADYFESEPAHCAECTREIEEYVKKQVASGEWENLDYYQKRHWARKWFSVHIWNRNEANNKIQE